VSRGKTNSSRAEWISPDYLVAPNRSESGHNGRARIVRHMSFCRCTIAMHPSSHLPGSWPLATG